MSKLNLELKITILGPAQAVAIREDATPEGVERALETIREKLLAAVEEERLRRERLAMWEAHDTTLMDHW